MVPAAMRPLLLLLMAAPAMAGPFILVSSTETSARNLKRTTSIVQNGANPLDRFVVEHVVKKDSRHRRGAIVLTPPLGSPASFYDQGDQPGGADFENSITAHLAQSNIDVYVYGPRASLLTPGACNTRDCSPMASWGMQARLDDLAYIQGLLRPDEKAVIGGLSLGGMTALAAVDQQPAFWAGLIDLDGILLVNDSALSMSYSLVCGGLHGQIAGGQWFNDTLNEGLQALLSLSVTDPGGLSPVPGFPPGTTNRQAYLIALTSPSDGPPGSIFPPGFTLTVGSVALNRLFFAAEDRVASAITAFSAYISNLEIADVTCALAGDPTFTSNLGQYKGPTLAFKQGAGFGSLIDANLAALGGPVTVADFPAFGHVDVVSSPRHKQLFEDRVLSWLGDAHVF
jgi:hypothetical protein